MKYVCVGDIHGKWEAVADALSMDGKKIFVGDFIDSYDRPVEDHRKCYDLLFPEIEKGNAVAVLGNHEMSYLHSHHRCSGWDIDRQILMHEYSGRINQLFLPYYFFEDNWLVTHAGLSNVIFSLHKWELPTLKETFDENITDMNSPLHWVGKSRGGFMPVGGIFWSHFPKDFDSIKGLNQIFGHTRGDSIREIKNKDSVNYCIDCLDFDHKFLTLET